MAKTLFDRLNAPDYEKNGIKCNETVSFETVSHILCKPLPGFFSVGLPFLTRYLGAKNEIAP